MSVPKHKAVMEYGEVEVNSTHYILRLWMVVGGYLPVPCRSKHAIKKMRRFRSIFQRPRLFKRCGTKTELIQ
jgi:hypothetical protein